MVPELAPELIVNAAQVAALLYPVLLVPAVSPVELLAVIAVTAVVMTPYYCGLLPPFSVIHFDTAVSLAPRMHCGPRLYPFGHMMLRTAE